MTYETYSIGNICSMVKGTYPTLNTEAGKYPLVVTAEYRRSASTYQLEGPAVCVPLISSTGHGDATLHRVHYQEGRFALANLLVALQPHDPNLCSTKYLYYLLTAKKNEYFVPLMSGTANVSLKIQDIAAVEISLPPLEEQQRIVARIEELAAKIEEARGLHKEAMEVAETLISSFLKEELGEIPVKGSLGEVLYEKPRNGWSVRCDNIETGVPVLSLGAVTGFTYRATEFKRTSEPISESAHYWLHAGDLLITRSNTPDLVGHAAIYDGSPSPCIYPDLMMRLNVNERVANKRFVHLWLRSTYVRDFIRKVAKGTSSSMVKISQETVMNIPFPSDLSLQMQNQIVASVNSSDRTVNNLKRLQAETSAELDALLPSILDKAFKGEL